MKTTPLLALFLLAAAVPPAWSRPVDEDWEGTLNLGESVLKTNAANHPAPGIPALLARPDDGACVEYGSRTEAVPRPRRPPLENTCNHDPLPDAASVQAAFDKVMAQVRAEDKREPAGPFDDLFPRGTFHFEQGIGLGTVNLPAISAQDHWADIATVHLKKGKDGKLSVVGGVLSTVRGHLMMSYDDLEADRVDFDMNADGSIRAAHKSRGLRMKGADRMSWSGPSYSPNTEQDLAGWWTIRYHQLLKAWADRTVGTPSTTRPR